MTSRDNSSSWCTYSACMVTEIKEYDIRAHRHGMVALMSRSLMVDFILFYFFILILIFNFLFFFLFLFLEQLGLGFISHAVTSVTN